MNFRYVLHQLGYLFLVLSAVMFVLAAVFFTIHQWIIDYEVEPYARQALILSSAMGAIVGGLMWVFTRGGPKNLGRKEALFLVAASWLLGAVLAALPFYLWASFMPDLPADHVFHNFTDCYFEATSGLTTTGASVLSDIEALPRSLLLWRAATHWLGGLGIVVLFVAVLPSLGVGARKLFRLESTSIAQTGLTPHIRDTAWVIAWIYVVITVVCVLALRATGAVDWFESISTALSMVSTGGLHPQNASVGGHDSAAVDLICLVFMAAGGVNFAIFYMIVRGQWRKAIRDTELRVYLAIKIIGIVIVFMTIVGLPVIVSSTGQIIENTPLESFRYGAFQSISLHTGTGFVTADYDQWPFVTRALLIGMMFIGGCAGSTSNGIKVFRFWIVLKILMSYFEKAFRPQVIRPIRLGDATVDEEMRLSALVYVISFVGLLVIGAFVIRFIEGDAMEGEFVTALSASLSTLSNIGPGIHGVGPLNHYGWFSAPSKWVMSILMILGRLEIFTVLVILTPRFWRTD